MDESTLAALRSAGPDCGHIAAAAEAEEAYPLGGRPSSLAGRSVTNKVLAILAAFSVDTPELNLTELARRAQLSVPTAHRRVAELLAWGALERTPQGRIRIGLRLWEVGSLAPRGLALREAALPYLEDLYELTHENVQLAVREDTEVVFVERITGRRAVPVHTRVGGRFDIHATGVGLALLAFAPPDVRDRVCASPLQQYTEWTIADPLTLHTCLGTVRAKGYAVSDRQITSDTLSVAAPILSLDGTARAAVSLVVRSDGAHPGPLAIAVRAAALGITRALASSEGRHLTGRNAPGSRDVVGMV
ncbi:IclR family transcriptional regulator [Rhodococcus sp. IEGM 1351]|uniref:IclR family transcriptional regulator n=1 Tax=Rhodococcus sp. IEGM 1351 TaxID=3047089 RepID=UPI0024B71630|nr:IclR family transcriptional regulator [Rhodococcus sp. IEGM 1351]MDI9941057.1 IclR family transcriptional regulator [Rhodococcus sp. IEGM 1351]